MQEQREDLYKMKTNTDLKQSRESQQRIDSSEIVKYLKRKQTDDIDLSNKQNKTRLLLKLFVSEQNKIIHDKG